MSNINQLVSYEGNADFFKLSILRECTFIEYGDAIDELHKEVGIDIPIKMFITDGDNFVKAKLDPQKIISMSIDDINYVFAISENVIKVCELINKSYELEEIDLMIDKESDAYSITKLIHDLNYSTISCKKYPFKGDVYEPFALTEEEALENISLFVDKLKYIEDKEVVKIVEYIKDRLLVIFNEIKREKVNKK